MFRLPAHFFPSSLTDRQQWVSFLLLAGGVSLVLVSIAASQILLSLAILAAILQWKRRDRGAVLPTTILLPLLFFLIWTIAATLIAGGSLRDALVKKLWLFCVLFLVPLFARGEGKIRWIYHAAFAAAAVSAVDGLVQFVINPHRDPMNRIKGFMSIWMTYSGLLMLTLVALVAYALIYGWKNHIWVIPLGLILAAAIYLSETRSAELGACIGVALVLLLKRPRAILGLAVLLLALYLVSPTSIQRRLRNGLNPADDNTRNRIEIFGAAFRLIQAHPWVGAGQRVNTEVLHYRGTSEFPNWMYIHMHNNFLQIAAERGIPGLLIWLWFMVQLGWQALLVFRCSRGGGEAGFAAVAAIGAWVALLAAGMFEYNFGDSEVLTLFLFIMSAPHATQVMGTE